MEQELTTLIARARGWQRAQRYPGLLILLAGLWALMFGDLWGLAFIPIGFWGAAEFWRGIRVTGDTLYAQGRLTWRTLPLGQIRQVGVTPSRTIWVQPVAGRTLVLPMAEKRTDREGSVQDLHDRLRELAGQAGADLEPELEERREPPRPATPFFGW